MLIVSLIIIVAISFILTSYEKPKATKIYWFIPDGVRAEPDLFTIYKWAEEGKLPNIKKMMDNGAYGYSIPDFPSHTPTNFATLLTGTHPDVHGVADGPMHIEGYPLTKPSLGGFSSTAKKVSPIWTIMENNDKNVLLLSMPGSTPPELDKGITIRGRWGGWGADIHALIFEPEENLGFRKQLGRAVRLFFFGPELTRYPEVSSADWENASVSFSPALETKMEGYSSIIYAYIYDSTDDNKINYDKIAFSKDKENIAATLSKGDWSEWIPLQLKWKDATFDSHVKIKVILLDDDGNFRVRLFYSNINEYIVDPSYVSKEIVDNVGPMVDFVDNFPPQLIYYPEDKQTFIEEANMSLNWHKEAIPFLLKNYNPDVFITDVYTPNQMLTSRWWLGYIDPVSNRYNDVSEEERDKLQNEVLWMYKKVDDILGKIIETADENTIIILSSDHGAVPLNKYVRLNNLFAQKGWLTFEINNETGEPVIDWDNTKVIFLKMAHIYVNPDGLGGNWTRASGEEYEALRDEVIAALYSLEDEDGTKPVINAVKWEDAPKFFDLPTDRVGDIVVANKAGYGWFEEMTSDLEVFMVPLKTGYKQAILAEEENGMWTPFIIIGPGVKKGISLENPISHIDQLPTILTLMGIEIPDYVEGKALTEIINN